MKKFDVKIHYTGFCSYKISAKNEEEAILKARDLKFKKDEYFSTLDNWEEADTAEELKDEESRI